MREASSYRAARRNATHPSIWRKGPFHAINERAKTFWRLIEGKYRPLSVKTCTVVHSNYGRKR